MAFKRVPAGNGVNWLTEAVNLILKNPTPFLLMGLLLGIVSAVPLLGGLALLIVGPALYGGVMYAAREQELGRTADFQHLFQAFREEGKLGRMLVLCLPAVAALILLVVLGLIFAGGALLGAAVAGASDSGGIFGAGLGLGTLLFVVLALAVGIAMYALTFFATPRVMLDGAEPIPAMKDSAAAALANVGAFLLYGVIVIVIVAVAGMILSMIPLVGPLLLSLVLMPTLSVAAYRAWRDVYGEDAGTPVVVAEPPTAPPPDAPPAQNPPAPPAAS